MSTRNLIAQFSSDVQVNASSNLTNDNQKRRWLAKALKEINAKVPNRDQQAIVQVISQSSNIALSRDYHSAEEEALLAVEYGYSAEYASRLGYDTLYGRLALSMGQSRSTLYPARSRYVVATPPAMVTSALVFGAQRMVLQLHQIPTEDRQEILIYNSLWQVTDPCVEFTVNANPEPNTPIIIAGQSYTFSNSAGSGLIKIGSNPNFTAAALLAAIIANADITGLQASIEGSIVTVFGQNADIDFPYTVDGSFVTAESLNATNNLTAKMLQRVFSFMESDHYKYLATSPALKIDNDLRKLYLMTAKDSYDRACDGLYSIIP